MQPGSSHVTLLRSEGPWLSALGFWSPPLLSLPLSVPVGQQPAASWVLFPLPSCLWLATTLERGQSQKGTWTSFEPTSWLIAEAI